MCRDENSQAIRALVTALGLAFGASANAAFVPSILSNGSDGAFRPQVSLYLVPDSDGLFNFTDIEIPADVSVSFDPSLFPTGITFLATGDIFLRGTLNAAGADLHVTTPHVFTLDVGSAFYANNYNIEAEQVSILGEFHTVPGGTANITNDAMNGGTSFSGFGVTMTMDTFSGFGVTETYEFLTPTLYFLTPTFEPFSIATVPLPASFLLMFPAIGLMIARRRKARS